MMVSKVHKDLSPNLAQIIVVSDLLRGLLNHFRTNFMHFTNAWEGRWHKDLHLSRTGRGLCHLL